MFAMARPDTTPRAIVRDRSRPSWRRTAVLATGLLTVAGIAAACSSDGSSADAQPTSADGVLTAVVELHAAPGCDCCGGWEEYMTSHGFTVESTEEADLSAFKEARGVPRDAWSCHTAVIDGYTVEVYSGQQRLLAMSYAYDQNETDPILDFLARLTKIIT